MVDARAIGSGVLFVLVALGSSTAQPSLQCDAVAQEALWTVGQDTMGLFVADAGRRPSGRAWNASASLSVPPLSRTAALQHDRCSVPTGP